MSLYIKHVSEHSEADPDPNPGLDHHLELTQKHLQGWKITEYILCTLPFNIPS